MPLFMSILTYNHWKCNAIDAACKHDNVQFATVPLETLIWSKVLKISSFFWLIKCLFLWVSSLLFINKKCPSYYSRRREPGNEKEQKHWNRIHTWADIAFKGTVVNQALPSFHGWSLEIRLTVPLIKYLWFRYNMVGILGE